MTHIDLGALFEKRQALKEANTRLNEQLNTNKADLKQVDEALGRSIRDLGVDSMKKGGYTASFEKKIGVKVNDWDKVFDYIFENEARHMLRRQLLQDPLQEMFEECEALPGAELYEYEKLSVKKTG